jgi:tetratricopeptide (TPR) repeat protein
VQKKAKEAWAAWDQAAALLAPLADAGPEYRFTLAQLHMVRGNGSFLVPGRRKEYAAAETLIDGLIQAHPADRRYRFTLADILTNRAHLASPDRKHEGQAEADCRRAVDLRRQLVREFPDSHRDQAYLAAALNHLGNALLRQGNHAAADAYEEAIRIYQKLEQAYPGVKSNELERKDVETNLKKVKRKPIASRQPGPAEPASRRPY